MVMRYQSWSSVSIFYGRRSKKNESYRVLPIYTIKIKTAMGTRNSKRNSASRPPGSGMDITAHKIAEAMTRRTTKPASLDSTYS